MKTTTSATMTDTSHLNAAVETARKEETAEMMNLLGQQLAAALRTAKALQARGVDMRLLGIDPRTIE